MFEQPKTKIQIGALFGCISDSLQPLAVHSHQLLCVQPNDSGKRNTAKSCTECSQYICSVVDLVLTKKWTLVYFSDLRNTFEGNCSCSNNLKTLKAKLLHFIAKK